MMKTKYSQLVTDCSRTEIPLKQKILLKIPELLPSNSLNKNGPPVNHGRAALMTSSNYFMKPDYFINKSFFTALKLSDPSWLCARMRRKYKPLLTLDAFHCI